MMTESYSPPEVIKKFYASNSGREGAHLPFNFQMITQIDDKTTAAGFVTMVTDWFKVIPAGKVTNWVVSLSPITNPIKSNNRLSPLRLAITIDHELQADSESRMSTFSTLW
jgi:hypothetical protein